MSIIFEIQWRKKEIEEVRKGGIPVETGIFGATMQVSLVNDGPFTLILER